jgi:hypothetical protein
MFGRHENTTARALLADFKGERLDYRGTGLVRTGVSVPLASDRRSVLRCL